MRSIDAFLGARFIVLGIWPWKSGVGVKFRREGERHRFHGRGEREGESTYCSALMEGAQRMEHTQGEQKGGTRVRAHGDGPGGESK